MLKLKILGLIGALVLAAPIAVEAAPAGGLTAQSFAPATATATESHAAVLPGDTTAKVEKVWWRGGWRGYGWRGYGWRRPFFRGYYGYGWRRPFWRRRWWY